MAQTNGHSSPWLIVGAGVTGIVAAVSLGLWVSSPSTTAGSPQSGQEQGPVPVATPKSKDPAQAGPPARKPLSDSEERSLRDGDSFSECADCPEMVVVPAGSFLMGSPDNEAGHAAAEGPVHQVTIAQPFAVARFPVTRAQFASFFKEAMPQLDVGCIAARLATEKDVFPSFGPGTRQTVPGKDIIVVGMSTRSDGSRSPNGFTFNEPGFPQGEDHPAVCVSWNDAKAFAAWISQKTHKSYRLLSEAEREYVARGAQRQRSGGVMTPPKTSRTISRRAM